MDVDLEHADRPTLIALIGTLRDQLAASQAQVATLSTRVAALEQRDPPPWAKANRPKRLQPRPPRKKRGRNFSRRVEAPTETMPHAVDTCPGCGPALGGGRVRWRRQVIDLPEAPVRVMEHVVIERRCQACGRTATPHPDLSDQVLGQHRVSLRLMARIAVLREQLRLPPSRVQGYLQTLHGLHLSRGELVAILQTVAKRAETAAGAIRGAIRQSPVVIRRNPPQADGGSRSAAGTLARATLWTLTDTWQLQHQPLLPAWVALFKDPAMSPLAPLPAAQ